VDRQTGRPTDPEHTGANRRCQVKMDKVHVILTMLSVYKNPLI